jgi:hypothetical protein
MVANEGLGRLEGAEAINPLKRLSLALATALDGGGAISSDGF